MTSSTPQGMRFPGWRRAMATLALAVVLLVELVSAFDLRDAAYSGLLLTQDLVIGRVVPNTPADSSGFQRGDLMNESPLRSPIPRPGETRRFRVRRGADSLSLSLTYAPLPRWELARKLSLGVVAIAFFLVGYVVYLRRSDVTALIFSLFCLVTGYIVGNVMNPSSWLLDHWPLADKLLFDAAVLALPPLFLHFFLLFPAPRRVLARRRALPWLLYVPSVIAFLAVIPIDLALLRPGGRPGPGAFAFQAATSLYFMIAFAVGALLFVRSYRRAGSAAMRRRHKVVVWGTVAGVLPLVLGQLLVVLAPGVGIPGARLAPLALVLIPLSFGHAILRYGILDVEIVIKQGVLYAVLTAVLAGLYLAVVNGVGRLVASSAPAGGRGVLTAIAILLMALVFTPLRLRVESWVDRTFYRDKQGYRNVLRRLARGLARMMDLDAILDLVANDLARTFHPEFLALYVRAPRHGRGDTAPEPDAGADADPARPAFTRVRDHGELGALAALTAAEEADLAGWLASRTEPVLLERSAAGSLPADLPLRARRFFSGAGVAALVPFVAEDELVAFLLLGSKKSQEPMGGEDGELLGTVADQAAIAIQNAWRHREALEREGLERELAVAREVQRALLPPATPELPGFELAVRCLPSREIGGDLYDFIPLEGGRLAVVVGDAAGQGIAAALLMAALQATIHGEAESAGSPSAVVAAANRKLCRRGDENRFASLVYGELDPARARFRYVNAGHPYPLHFRAGTLETLEAGGLILGVEPDARYDEETLELTPGSLLVFYTDGIVEHRDRDEEEFGRERLVALVGAEAGRPLHEILRAVLDAVNRHGAEPLADDATLLALRYTGARGI